LNKDDSAASDSQIKRLLQAAGQCMVDGRYSDATDIYKQAVLIGPRNVDALAGLGMSLGRQNKLDEADEQFDKVLSLDSKNAVAHCGKAMVLINRFSNSKDSSGKINQQLLKEAGKECNKALDSDPRVVEAHYLLGKVYREENRLDRAELAFAGAVKLDPHYGGAWVALGMIQTQREKYAAALASFNQAITVSPNNSHAYFGKGVLFAKQGQLDRAIKEFNMSIYKNANNPEVHLALGKAFDQQGDSVAAVKEFQEAIKLKPDDPEQYIALSTEYENRGELETAITKLRSGLKVMPNDPELRLLVGNANLRAGQIDEAIADYQTALTNSSKAPEAAQGLVRALYIKSQKGQLGLTESIKNSGDYQRAQVIVKELANGNPNNLVMQYLARELAALAGEAKTSDELRVPQSDAERVALAEAYLAEGRFGEAEDLFKRAIYNANKAKDTFYLADLAYSLRELDIAELAFRKGLTFVNSESRAHKGLEACSTARQSAQAEFAQAEDLSRRHLYDQAALKYRDAIFGEPKNAQAHLGLAQTLERASSAHGVATAQKYKRAIAEYKLYLRLTPGALVKTADKCKKRIERLNDLVAKLEPNSAASTKSEAKQVSAQ
jgi:tetratricopeptide (TPR) repeat protein